MERMIDNDYVNIGGSATFLAAFTTCIIEFLSQYTFNDYAQGILMVIAIVYGFYKVKNSILDAKIKERSLKDGIRVEEEEKETPVQRLFKRTKKKV